MDSINKSITKTEEIALLKELASGDSYFSNAFSEQDVNQMILNIQNDWPLLLHTGIEHYSAIGQNHVRQQSRERNRQFIATMTAEVYGGIRYLYVVVCYGEATVTLEVRESDDGKDFVSRITSEYKRIDHWGNWSDDYSTVIESFGRASFQALIYDNFHNVEAGTTICRRY